MHALLLTGNDRLKSEFKKFVAVTQSELVIGEMASREQIKNAYRVFIDQESGISKIDHDDVVLVASGALGPDTWELALQLKANFVAEMANDREWLIDHLAAPATKSGICVAVIPGCGGAGATTIASALAFHAKALVESVALIDCDQTSAGIDIVTGSEQIAGMRWRDFISLTNSINATDIARGLPSKDGVKILSTSSEPATISETEVGTIVNQLLTVNDLVILDLERHEGIVRDSKLLELADVILVVVPSTVRGCASADRVIENITENHNQVEVVVRSIPGTSLSPIEIAHLLNTPLAGSVNSDSRIAEQIEQGFGIGAIQLGSFTRSINALANRLLPECTDAYAA
jgi:secretion/DNA translocation related CpaE-like protein